MKKYKLEVHHKEHLAAIGIPNVAELAAIHATQEDYENAYAAWERTLPHADDETLHMKALANLAWMDHAKPKPNPVLVPEPIPEPVSVLKKKRFDAKDILLLLLILVILGMLFYQWRA